ncbi:hypothetical protein BSKO_11860 [Bryopsis sp. KO-2023]|nr:hypothetical protein BSKO_11860 [Bryopsis sp. KO-2023]
MRIEGQTESMDLHQYFREMRCNFPFEAAKKVEGVCPLGPVTRHFFAPPEEEARPADPPTRNARKQARPRRLEKWDSPQTGAMSGRTSNKRSVDSLYDRHPQGETNSKEQSQSGHVDGGKMHPGKLLERLLNSKTRRWILAEFLTSAIDRPWLMSNTFEDVLKNLLKLDGSMRLSRCEWSMIRSVIIKPRRFSPKFLAAEREKWEQYRMSVRAKYIECRIGCDGLPCAKALRVGQQVVARHPITKRIHDGMVLSVGSSAYRVHFSHDMGVEFVPDVDLMPINPFENLPLVLLDRPLMLNGRTHRPNEKDGDTSDSSDMMVDEPDVMRTTSNIIAVMSKFLNQKEALLKEMKQLNDRASQQDSKGGVGDAEGGQRTSYAGIILRLKELNSNLESLDKAMDKAVPSKSQQKLKTQGARMSDETTDDQPEIVSSSRMMPSICLTMPASEQIPNQMPSTDSQNTSTSAPMTDDREGVHSQDSVETISGVDQRHPNEIQAAIGMVTEGKTEANGIMIRGMNIRSGMKNDNESALLEAEDGGGVEGGGGQGLEDESRDASEFIERETGANIISDTLSIICVLKQSFERGSLSGTLDGALDEVIDGMACKDDKNSVDMARLKESLKSLKSLAGGACGEW